MFGAQVISIHVHVDDQLKKVVDDILGKDFTILKLICILYMHGAYYNLGEDVCFQVFTSVYSVRANWYDVCLALGLPPSLLSAIRTNHPDDVRACLHEGLSNWLQRNYNTELHGLPSWGKLVKAVDHPAGGSNPALALKIAEEHKS